MTPTMAALINPLSPVTPPPDNQTFAQKPVPLQPPLNPPLHPSLPRMGWGFDLPFPPLATFGVWDQTARQEQQRLGQSQTQKWEEAESSKPEPPVAQQPPRPTTSIPTSSTSQHPQASDATQPQLQPQMQVPGSPPAHIEPKDLATAARIAAFYQQRCHAIATYQQQRFQAWASAYRKKCHETTQAAVLVVAWYVRDRIRRRRRRQKARFRRGIREMTAGVRPVRKGEAVRRWVTGVPHDVLPPNTVPMDKVADKEEGGFLMDEEVPPDKETELLEMADGLIKSQYRGVEVPLMGVLSFDESDSDSEESEELCAGCKWRSSAVEGAGDAPGQEYNGDDEDYDDCDEEDLYEDEDMNELEHGSELVHGGGTGQHSQDTEDVLPLL